MRVHHSLLRRTVGAIVVCALFVTGASADPIQLPSDFVIVGNAGNQGNTAHFTTQGYGAVGYQYGINKFEVTAGQYRDFLEAVASTSDPHGLYNPSMWSSNYGSKIQQSPSGGGYSYSVASDYANRPVNFVSWYDAARYANWLTSGDTESGAYQFDGGGNFVGIDRAGAVSLYDIAYVLPTHHEWYKAAFHKNDGATGNYWGYPTGTDTVPSNEFVNPDPGNNATFLNANPPPPLETLGPPYYRTEVGEFENSESAYGTFDQGGNVWEWNETLFTSSQRGTLGGSFESYATHLRAEHHHQNAPGTEHHAIGFRVGAYYIPEPGSAMMLLFGALAGLLWRRRRG